MRKLIKKSVAAALSTALLVTLGPVADISIVKAADDYTYLYAGLTWDQYWAAENIYLQSDKAMTDSNSEADAREEMDKGAFDAVSRATTSHGLHRGSYQCDATIYGEDGSEFNVSHWSADGKTLYLTDGTEVSYSKGTITKTDGTQTKLKEYKVTGIKYVPVAVKTSELVDFKKVYKVVENEGELVGGYSEVNLSSYDLKANVTADTNGIKTATEQKDGTFKFSARKTGKDSGIKDQTLLKASKIKTEVKAAKGSYGEFLRVDINNADDADTSKGEGYGALGSKMQAVKWTYYGDDAERKTALANFGTKFAADNWMHKVKGIQLGLTDSYRAALPGGTNGTGYWSLTVYALGYEDETVNFEVTKDNIVDTVNITENADTTKLSDLVKDAKGLKESDYTTASWKDFVGELEEAEEELAKPKHYQAMVDEAYNHLSAAIKALVKEEKALNAPASVKVAAKKKSFTVTWKKVNGAKGYQVQYSLTKNFKKAAVKNVTKTTLTVKKLKSGKKYFVRVKAVASDKKLNSGWSAAKPVKVK